MLKPAAGKLPSKAGRGLVLATNSALCPKSRCNGHSLACWQGAVCGLRTTEEACVSLCRTVGPPGSGECPGLPNCGDGGTGKGCPGVQQLQTQAEMGRVSTALQKMAAGQKKSLGTGEGAQRMDYMG